VSVKFEPAHEGVALAVFGVVRFRETTQPGAEPITVALADLGKNPDATYAGRIRDAFHDVTQKSFDIVETPEDAREAQQRHGYRCLGSLKRWLCAAHKFRRIRCQGVIAQIPIFLEHPEMIESARNQGLEPPAIDLQILRGVNAGMLHVPERLRAQRPESDHQDFRKGRLNLFEKIAGFFRAQIEDKNGRTVLLQDGVEAVRRRNVAHLRQRRQKSLRAADEVGILRIEDAYWG
jgi:hypothetical protein